MYTGRLDSATVRLMNQRRCGLPDIETPDDNSQNVQHLEGIARRKKRYALRETALAYNDYIHTCLYDRINGVTRTNAQIDTTLVLRIT